MPVPERSDGMERVVAAPENPSPNNQHTRHRACRGVGGRDGAEAGPSGVGLPRGAERRGLGPGGGAGGRRKTLHGNGLMAVAGGTARCAGGQAYSHPVSERVTAPRAVWPEGQRKSPSTAQPGMPQAAPRLAAAPARPAAPRVRASGLPVGGGPGRGPTGTGLRPPPLGPGGIAPYGALGAERKGGVRERPRGRDRTTARCVKPPERRRRDPVLTREMD